jgi:hypothetical protein
MYAHCCCAGSELVDEVTQRGGYFLGYCCEDVLLVNCRDAAEPLLMPLRIAIQHLVIKDEVDEDTAQEIRTFYENALREVKGGGISVLVRMCLDANHSCLCDSNGH